MNTSSVKGSPVQVRSAATTGEFARLTHQHSRLASPASAQTEDGGLR